MSLRALFGGVLQGSKPVHYIYMDEAGTSRQEPVSVVAGILVHADTKWKKAETAIQEILDRLVPSYIRDGFIFHATEVFSGGKTVDRNNWPANSRWRLIEEMTALPRKLGLPVSFGVARRDGPPLPKTDGMPDEVLQHVLAFGVCIDAADYYLQKHFDENEVASLVAEECHTARKHLESMPNRLRTPTMMLSPRSARGEQHVMQISKIIDGVYWQNKNSAVLLQIADACAFAMRRYLSELSQGERLITALLGEPFFSDEWARWRGNPMTAVTYYWDWEAASRPLPDWDGAP